MSRRRCLARAARWSRATALPRRRSRRAAPPCRCRHGRPAHSSRCEETLLTASLPVHRHGVPCSPPPSLAPPAPRPAERRRRGRSRTRKAAAAPPPPDSRIPNWSDRYPLTAQRRHLPLLRRRQLAQQRRQHLGHRRAERAGERRRALYNRQQLLRDARQDAPDVHPRCGALLTTQQASVESPNTSACGGKKSGVPSAAAIA